MQRLGNWHWTTNLSLAVGGLALVGCQGGSSQPQTNAGSDKLAMFVDDCAESYLSCRNDCLDAPSGTNEDTEAAGSPRVAGVSGEPGYPGAGGGAGGLDGAQMHCFYPIGQPGGTPAATAEYVLEIFAGKPSIHIRLTFNPDFVDNTYGAGAIGWRGKGHKFKDLVGSDHAEFVLYDKIGVEKVHVKLDYISATDASPSGYAALGVKGGEGKMIVGDENAIVAASSSLDRNLNERGYGEYLVDSPVTNEKYAPNPDAPDWDYRVVYEVWVKRSAFGLPGFGSAKMSFVHASPSKAADNTLEVVERKCPPDWIYKDTDTGSAGDTDTGSTGDTDTGSAGDTESRMDDSSDSNTGSNQTSEDSDSDTTQICLTECETIILECSEDVRCNETPADDPCVDAFPECVDTCQQAFEKCAEREAPKECEAAFDGCVKTCVAVFDACTREASEVPVDENDICEPPNTDPKVF